MVLTILSNCIHDFHVLRKYQYNSRNFTASFTFIYFFKKVQEKKKTRGKRNFDTSFPNGMITLHLLHHRPTFFFLYYQMFEYTYFISFFYCYYLLLCILTNFLFSFTFLHLSILCDKEKIKLKLVHTHTSFYVRCNKCAPFHKNYILQI